MDYKKKQNLDLLLAIFILLLAVAIVWVVPAVLFNTAYHTEPIHNDSSLNSTLEINSTTNNTTYNNITTTSSTIISTITTSAQIKNKVVLDVKNILQNPELPTGCEITSATILLNYYGFNVDKMEMLYLLPKSNNFYYLNGNLIGPNTNEYFCGDPTSTRGYGLQCFAPVIEKTLNLYLDSVNSNFIAKDISGTDLVDLYTYLNYNNPVITWVSIGMVQPYKKQDWIDEQGNPVTSYRNLHCLVMIGYDEEFIYVADPLGTLDKVDKNLFEDRYNYLGKQSVIIQTN